MSEQDKEPLGGMIPQDGRDTQESAAEGDVPNKESGAGLGAGKGDTFEGEETIATGQEPTD
ncbi:hypothetical protein [Georgenia sp. AZ-5]|uniref:hypothetical protein n=1 Tax=Georgenia sp. AZ-5 TaxID=3367526 RepID=UPI003754F1B9